MNKIQGVKTFLENVVFDEMDCFIDRLLEYVNKNEMCVTESIVSSFKAVCRAKENSPEDNRRTTEYIQFTLSRSDAMLRENFYKIEIFDKNLYRGGYVCGVPLTIDWLYREFYIFCDCISEKSKRYIGQIRRPELERIQLSALETSQKLMKYLVKKALKKIVETEEYRNLPDAVSFHVSSYRGPFQVIYVKDIQMDQWRKYLNGLLQDQPG